MVGWERDIEHAGYGDRSLERLPGRGCYRPSDGPPAAVFMPCFAYPEQSAQVPFFTEEQVSSNVALNTEGARKHLISLRDINAEEQAELVRRAVFWGSQPRLTGSTALQGCVVGILFTKTSTRTRTSYSAATLRLGGQVIAYGPEDLQLKTGETVEDTARVLGGMLDGLVVRTAGPESELRAFAEQPGMAVVNAMTENEHPTQAITDLAAFQEHFGRLSDLHVLYVGEGNNTAAALALAVARTPGMRLSLATPAGYGLDAGTLETAQGWAQKHGASVEEFHETSQVSGPVDVVYATRWQTTGSQKPDPNWRSHFEPFKATADLMSRFSRGGTVFAHDLPAHRGEDVEACVLDGPQSIAFRQAQFKYYGALAVMEWVMGTR